MNARGLLAARGLLGLLGLLGGCATGAGSAAGEEGERQPPAARAEAARADGAAPSEPLLDEASARALLSARFRDAGLRIRYDVPLSREGAFSFTADGYDPARGVGYEYVNVRERGAELDAAELAPLANDEEHRILVIDAASRAALEALSARFLAELAPR